MRPKKIQLMIDPPKIIAFEIATERDELNPPNMIKTGRYIPPPPTPLCAHNADPKKHP